MDHFDALAEAVKSTMLVANPDLIQTEDAVHNLLAKTELDPERLLAAMEGEEKLTQEELDQISSPITDPKAKYADKFGALALLSALAWTYDPRDDEETVANQSKEALNKAIEAAKGRTREAGARLANMLLDPSRDTSVEDLQTILLTHGDEELDNEVQASIDPTTEGVQSEEELVTIEDQELIDKIVSFPWIDSPAEDIKLEARKISGLQSGDALVVDLTPYSSVMQPIVQEAKDAYSDETYRTMENSQISMILLGKRTNYVKPPSFRDHLLPTTYCAKNGSGASLRRIYLAQLGDYEGMPVFARLAIIHKKINQSKISTILGYYPVKA